MTDLNTHLSTHLGEDRLFELGVDASLAPSGDEASHLESCAPCRDSLAAERRLGLELVAAIPRVEPPLGFVAATGLRFAAARRAAEARRRLMGLVTAAAACLAIGVPAAAVLALNGGEVIRNVVLVLKQVAVVISAISLVAGKIPLAPVVLSGAAASVILGWSACIGRLAQLTAPHPPLGRLVYQTAQPAR